MSYSQNGEDAIVASCFPPDFKGVLLEVGAWFPKDFSNSRLLIEAGWLATLCEFSPLAVDRLVREYGYHPRVRVIAAAITAEPQHLLDFQITEDALSSDNPAEVAKWKDMRPGYSGGFYGHLLVPTLSLHALLSERFGATQIDFASIDTEGSSVPLAIALLRTDHRPKVLCVEHNGRDLEVWEVAKPLGYKWLDKNQENLILCR